MPSHIHEETPIKLTCLLKEGKPAGSSVSFVVYHDKVETATLTGSVAAEASAPAGKAASVDYTPPKVADDKPSYVITYKAVADGEDYKSDEEIQVWPRKAKLTSRNEGDTEALKNFKFKVMQSGAQFGTGNQTSNADPSVTEFRLDKGSPFALAGVTPYEIVGDPEVQGGKLRDLKSKGKVTFVAEFVSPKRPADGKIKQWINLVGDVAKKGVDAMGHEVEVTVGVLGDRDAATGVAKAELIGAAGVYVYVNVKFSGPANTKSLRNSPNTDLVAGLNLIDRVVVKGAATDASWEITGRVDLALADGVGKFKLELGQAGGDTCVVSIGSNKACDSAQLSFTNWRKLWYEILAPDFMELEDHVVDTVTLRDFAAGGLANLKGSGDATFIEYQIHKSHSFTEAEAIAACAGSVMKREFFQRASGPAKVYLLTDFTYMTDPKAFDGSKGRRGILLKACDINLYNDGPGVHADQDSNFDVTAAAANFDFPDSRMYWSPVSAWGGGAGAESIKSITWKAAIASPATYRGRPGHSFEANGVDASIDGGAETATYLIAETLQNPAACSVVFAKPADGALATALDAAAELAIKSWLATLWAEAKVRPHNFVMRFKISGRDGDARFNAVRTLIAAHITSSAPEMYKHRGLKPDGTVRTATLAWRTVVNMDRSHHQRIAIDLPAVDAEDPGKLAGALSATHCPISLKVVWEQQRAANGLASNGQVLVKWGLNCPKCITDTYLHEVGHHFNMTETAHGLPGLPAAKGLADDETLAAYQHNGTKGHYYTGLGHSGGHCAWGLTDADKGLPSVAGKLGVCTLYGEGGRDDTTRRRLSFCPQCQDILRATPLE